MRFRITPGSQVAIYKQIADQIRRQWPKVNCRSAIACQRASAGWRIGSQMPTRLPKLTRN